MCSLPQPNKFFSPPKILAGYVLAGDGCRRRWKWRTTKITGPKNARPGRRRTV